MSGVYGCCVCVIFCSCVCIYIIVFYILWKLSFGSTRSFKLYMEMRPFTRIRISSQQQQHFQVVVICCRMVHNWCMPSRSTRNRNCNSTLPTYINYRCGGSSGRNSNNLMVAHQLTPVYDWGDMEVPRAAGVMSPLVGAIDEGTSSARFMLFKAGTTEVVASHQQELKSFFPQEGWVEQDPMEILDVVRNCIKATLDEWGGPIEDIVSVGVTNQRESIVVWDRTTGRPLHNLIVWRDMRTTSTVDQLLDKIPNKSRNINYLKPLCGLPLSPYFSAVKLRWLCDHVPAVKKAMTAGTCLFGTVDTWLIWSLTGGGVHVTDVTNASRTMLMNIDTLKWDPVLVDFFDLTMNCLPEIRSSSEVYGRFSEGPLEGVPLAGCLGDQQAALVGQQCLNRGQAKATYGTGCFLLYNTGPVKVDSAHGLLTTVAYQFGPEAAPHYALEGSVAVAGAALNWLRDNLRILPSFGQVQQLAQDAGEQHTGQVCFVPAFSGLYAPYWQQDARGIIVGITDDTNSTHIIRAALEAVCFQIRDVLEAMNHDYGTPLKQLQVDGGMTANQLLMQLQADLAGITVIKPLMAESTALGAAIVAGLAVGRWSLDDGPMMVPTEEWLPKYSDNERDVRYAQWKMAVERTMGWDT